MAAGSPMDGTAGGAGIEAIGLVREFKKGPRAVDGINLRVEPGEIYGFLGPNGAGKSTTVLMLTTLLPPTAGTARVAGGQWLLTVLKVELRQVLERLVERPVLVDVDLEWQLRDRAHRVDPLDIESVAAIAHEHERPQFRPRHLGAKRRRDREAHRGVVSRPEKFRAAMNEKIARSEERVPHIRDDDGVVGQELVDMMSDNLRLHRYSGRGTFFFENFVPILHRLLRFLEELSIGVPPQHWK